MTAEQTKFNRAPVKWNSEPEGFYVRLILDEGYGIFAGWLAGDGTYKKYLSHARRFANIGFAKVHARKSALPNEPHTIEIVENTHYIH
jgi:hypothetical protein